MAEFVYFENGVMVEAHDQLPRNWRNVSGLNLITDLQTLASLGWYLVQKDTSIPVDPSTQRVVGHTYSLVNGKALETPVVEAIPAYLLSNHGQPGIDYDNLRYERDKRLAACDWTILPDVIAMKSSAWAPAWYAYRQQLRDLPANTTLETGINWPTPPQVA